jgi:hypothetical protein
VELSNDELIQLKTELLRVFREELESARDEILASLRAELKKK